jgi:RNA polymerase sigma-70 factor (ECF subfamily)
MTPTTTLEDVYRKDGRRVFATLVRLLGSFDTAEEALHEAFLVATERWPRDGVPANPVAWLVSAGRFKAIDQMRRQRRFTAWDDAAEVVDNLADDSQQAEPVEELEDDRCASSSPAATPACPRKRALRLPCAKSAA